MAYETLQKCHPHFRTALLYVWADNFNSLSTTKPLAECFYQESAHHAMRGTAWFQSDDGVILTHVNTTYSISNRTKSAQGMLWPCCPLFWSLENYSFPWSVHLEQLGRQKELLWRGDDSGDLPALGSPGPVIPASDLHSLMSMLVGT